jgi:hypothetical protein
MTRTRRDIITRDMTGLIRAMAAPSRTPKARSLPIADLPAWNSLSSALEDLTSRISERTRERMPVNAAFSSMVLRASLDMKRPMGTRTKAATGRAPRMIRVILQLR